MGLQPVTKYEIKVSMIFDDQRRTDSAIIIQETAPSSSGLEISKIESTAFSLSWDAIDNVANYNIVIKIWKITPGTIKTCIIITWMYIKKANFYEFTI